MTHLEMSNVPRLNTPEFMIDPYPAYAWLREHAPVYFSPEWNGFLVTRYDDVAAGFRDPRLLAGRGSSYVSKLPPAELERLMPLIRNFSRWMVFLDAPDHTRLRGLVNRAFAPRLIETMRPRLQVLVEALLKEACALEHPELEVMEALAVPLPVLAISEVMGLPPSDRQHLKRWADALTAATGARQVTPEAIAQAVSAIVELEQYFRDHIARRRRNSTHNEDLLTLLIGAEEQGSILDEQELLSTCAMLLFGGHETTTNLIGNAAWLLACHQEQQSFLRNNPAAIPQAVEEILRFESPFQRIGRMAAEDLVLNGQTIQKGQIVNLVIGAANRDQSRFPKPDVVDFQRTANHHLAFGHGSHFCIGVTLARLQGQLALGGLLRALPQFSLGGKQPERLDHFTLRGFKRLHISSQPTSHPSRSLLPFSPLWS